MQNFSLFSALQKILRPFLSRSPASQLIRNTARKEFKLIFLNISSSIVESFSEGATLGLVFVAIKVLSEPASLQHLKNLKFLALSPSIITYLNNLPETTLFLIILLAALLVQALQSFSRFVNVVSIYYFSARLRSIVMSKIHDQILKFSFSFSSGYKVGDLLDYSLTGPEAIRIQIEQSSNLFVLILLSLVYFCVLIAISPWLLVAVGSIGGVILVLQRTMLPRIRTGSENVAEETVNINSIITEDMQALRLLHSTGQLESANKRLDDNLSRLEIALRMQAPRLAVLAPVSSFLPILAITLILASSLFILGSQGKALLPSLVTFVLALQRLTIRVNMIAGITNTLADNSGRIKRLNYILSREDKEFRRLGGIQFSSLSQCIRFDNVSLQYGNSTLSALKNISFAIDKGSTVALVGSSGAGKSSIADLLAGLYTPTSGNIFVDNVPLDSYDIASWQSRLGIVSQDTFLFNSSIADNISFGVPWATQDLVEKACKAAQAHDFINALPASYLTVVGERGYRLSGGQRQRLSLARAFLRKPDLLVLDEATSALDSHNEQLVQNAIKDFENDHTLLIIAHRLSTITAADLILVLESGSIIQSGTHDELINIDGMYRSMWNVQVS